MRSVHDIIRAHLLDGVFLDPMPRPVPLTEVRRRDTKRSERLAKVDRLCSQLRDVGFYRYEQCSGYAPHKNIESVISRCQRYLADGNQLHLADCLNLIRIELDNPGSHPAPQLITTGVERIGVES
jgi:hypothetical protein